jgi:CRISPR/Cas system CMR-associated protein Cmr3 (group 5 of RAMP superfamily)
LVEANVIQKVGNGIEKIGNDNSIALGSTEFSSLEDQTFSRRQQLDVPEWTNGFKEERRINIQLKKKGEKSD